MTMGANPPTYKLVVVGDGGVGKSAITIQFFQRTFMEGYDPTIEDTYTKHVAIDGESCILDVLDTAGQEEFSPMRDTYMRHGDGFLIVYSVTDRMSYENVTTFHESILRVKDSEAYPILLVANKTDLVNLRRVTEEEGQRLANELNVKYIATSAKDPPLNIDESFFTLVRMIRAAHAAQQRVVSKEKKKTASLKTCCNLL